MTITPEMVDKCRLLAQASEALSSFVVFAGVEVWTIIFCAKVCWWTITFQPEKGKRLDSTLIKRAKAALADLAGKPLSDPVTHPIAPKDFHKDDPSFVQSE